MANYLRAADFLATDFLAVFFGAAIAVFVRSLETFIGPEFIIVLSGLRFSITLLWRSAKRSNAVSSLARD
jgi:membrane protein implicated in regulation of membrane protease activity